LFELLQTVLPARRNELFCDTQVVSALTNGGYDAAVAEWLLALPQEQLARVLAGTNAAGALLHAGRGKLVIALLETLTVAQRVPVLSRWGVLSGLVDGTGFRRLSSVDWARARRPSHGLGRAGMFLRLLIE
jgi:hypothetical protein